MLNLCKIKEIHTLEFEPEMRCTRCWDGPLIGSPLLFPHLISSHLANGNANERPKRRKCQTTLHTRRQKQKQQHHLQTPPQFLCLVRNRCFRCLCFAFLLPLEVAAATTADDTRQNSGTRNVLAKRLGSNYEPKRRARVNCTTWRFDLRQSHCSGRR